MDDYTFCMLRAIDNNKAKVLPFSAESIKDTDIIYLEEENPNDFKVLSVIDVHKIATENNHDWFLKWFSR